MAFNRRNFLKASLGSAALASIASCTGKGSDSCCGAGGNQCVPYVPNVKLNLSFQEGTLQGDTLTAKLDLMEKLGVNGLEVSGRGISSRVSEIKQALSGRAIKVSAVCTGVRGFMLSEDENVRNDCRESIREILIAAGELGSTGLIVVPAFNRDVPCKPHTPETRDFLCKWFDEIGTFARANGTTVILEPLNRREAHFLRQVADAASICRDINNPGITCMGDFWHMTHEEASDMGAFIAAGKYLQHVHIASRGRRLMPGEDGEVDNYVEGFRGLKILGYDKYVSFECGTRAEDRNAAAAAAVELLRKQWDEA